MAQNQRYRVKFRRRRELRTDYKRRLGLVKSGMLRLVVRRSSSNVVAQIIEFHPEGDMTLSSATGTELRKTGWKGGLGNIPACYLVGLLLSKKSKSDKPMTLDIGRQHSARGGCLFAVLKGCIDGGLSLKVDEKAYPSEERIRGEHIASNSVTKYTKVEKDIVANFEEVRKKIQEGSQ